MSTTNTCSGYHEDRPTSKVLAPPGGASSNIFGAPEPSPTPVQKIQEPDVTPAGCSTPNKPAGEGIDTFKDRMQGGGNTEVIKTKAEGNRKNQATYNFMTGEETPAAAKPNEEEDTELKNEKKNSITVKNPPGGKSSIDWM